MINIKNCFIAVACIMPIAPAFSGCLCEDQLKTVKNALNGKQDILYNKDRKLTEFGADSVVGALGKIFVFDDKEKERSGQSIMDAKIDLYTKNFYQWYGQDAFKAVDIDKNKEKADVSADVSTANFFKKYGQEALKKDYEDVDKAVNTEVKDYIDKSLGKKQAKTRGNDTNTSADLEKAAKDQLIKQVDEYIQNKPAQAGNNTTYPAMLNPLKVFTIDEARPLTSNQTKEFISSIKDSSPTIRKFYLPSTIKEGSSSVSITVPAYGDPVNGAEKTSIELSMDVNKDVNPAGFKARYTKMKTDVEDSFFYRKYSLKLLSDLAIKSGLISNIAYMFKKREVITSPGANKPSKISLAEKERNMALEGLDPAYYGTKGEPLSIAALNLKTLHANNKMIYFMYQILRQIEYANYIQSLKSLQEQQLTSMTDDNDIREITALIKK